MKLIYVFEDGAQIPASFRGAPCHFSSFDDAAGAFDGGDAGYEGLFWPEGREPDSLIEIRIVREEA